MVSIHETDPTKPQTIWTLEEVGDFVAFLSDQGTYLHRCYQCWKKSTKIQAVGLKLTTWDSAKHALWKPKYLDNGKWSFRSDTGEYLTLCNKCVTGGKYDDFAFVYNYNDKSDLSQFVLTVAEQ